MLFGLKPADPASLALAVLALSASRRRRASFRRGEPRRSIRWRRCARLTPPSRSGAPRARPGAEEVPMLGEARGRRDHRVRDTGAARKFYEGKLGLKAEDVRDEEVVTYASGRSRLFVYKSGFAGTNRRRRRPGPWTTSTAWRRDLKSKGVPFERYDIPG
jgi:MYXO-CTERM domain-containing protein